MVLIIPKDFLKWFFECLYYSILSDCVLWGKKSSIFVEPICSLKIDDGKIVDYKLIDEWLDPSFNRATIRKQIRDGIMRVDSTDLDQALDLLIENVFELTDNRFLYPGKRLSTFVSQVLPNDLTISSSVDGICHFHSTTDANFSEIDFKTMKKLAGVMKKNGKNNIIGLVIAKGNPKEYIKKSTASKSQFVDYMMNDLDNTGFNARIFYSKGKDANLDTSIEND